MKGKNYPKQILDLLDSKANRGLTSREIANSILIKEDKEENLNYIRQNITRLRKRQKIYISYVNKNRERTYCSIRWVIEMFEKEAFEDPIASKLSQMDYIINLFGYVKKEEEPLMF